MKHINFKAMKQFFHPCWMFRHTPGTQMWALLREITATTEAHNNCLWAENVSLSPLVDAE